MQKERLNKEIIFELLQQNSQTLRRLGVQQIGLFGSFVRDEANAESDLDFLVNFEKEKKTLGNLVDLGELLEGVFNKKVDIVMPQGLSPYIGPHILKEVQYVPLAH